MTINNNVDIVRKHGNYYIHISVETKEKDMQNIETVCGVDPGIRTLATVYSTNKSSTQITEYIHRKDLLKILNKKIDMLKERKTFIRKKQYNKIEKTKKDIVDSVHWDLVNDILKNNDVIYFGDIKSHGIVKDGNNKTLNRDFNDLKLYVLKQRLKYKATIYCKNVVFVNEAYTTKTCSCCGVVNNNVGSKEVFTCESCDLTTGRDTNASKNIMMKGLLV